MLAQQPEAAQGADCLGQGDKKPQKILKIPLGN